MNAALTRGRLWTPDFVRITFLDLAYFLAAGMLFYALPRYAVGPVGAGEAGAGLAFGVYTLTALVLRPFAGRLSDRVGRRLPLVAGALLAALCTSGFLVTTSIVTVIALRLLMGIAEALFFVSGFALLADLAPPDRQGEALSLNSVGLYLGIALGPLVAERIVELGGFTTAFACAAALCAVAAWMAWSLAEPPPSGDPPTDLPVEPDSPLIHRRTIAPSLGFLGGMYAAAGFMAFGVLRADDLGLSTPSLVLLAYGATVVAVRLLAASAADRYPPLRVVAGGVGIIAAGCLLAAATSGPVPLLLSAVVIGLGIALLTPAYFAAVFASVPPQQRGAASGTATMTIDLGLGGGPIVSGFVATSFGIPGAFVLAAAIATSSMLWTVNLDRRERSYRELPAS